MKLMFSLALAVGLFAAIHAPPVEAYAAPEEVAGLATVEGVDQAVDGTAVSVLGDVVDQAVTVELNAGDFVGAVPEILKSTDPDDVPYVMTSPTGLSVATADDLQLSNRGVLVRAGVIVERHQVAQNTYTANVQRVAIARGGILAD